MAGKKCNKLSSWIFVYAALIAATVFTGQSGAVAPQDPADLSPVILSGDSPYLAVDAVVRRSDL